MLKLVKPIDIGNKLIEVKARLGHGNFGTWLDTEFGWGKDTANRFMNVASNFANCEISNMFAPSALYLLSAPSTPDEARHEAIECVSSTEDDASG